MHWLRVWHADPFWFCRNIAGSEIGQRLKDGGRVIRGHVEPVALVVLLARGHDLLRTMNGLGSCCLSTSTKFKEDSVTSGRRVTRFVLQFVVWRIIVWRIVTRWRTRVSVAIRWRYANCRGTAASGRQRFRIRSEPRGLGHRCCRGSRNLTCPDLFLFTSWLMVRRRRRGRIDKGLILRLHWSTTTVTAALGLLQVTPVELVHGWFVQHEVRQVDEEEDKTVKKWRAISKIAGRSSHRTTKKREILIVYDVTPPKPLLLFVFLKTKKPQSQLKLLFFGSRLQITDWNEDDFTSSFVFTQITRKRQIMIFFFAFFFLPWIMWFFLDDENQIFLWVFFVKRVQQTKDKVQCSTFNVSSCE